MSVLEGLQYIKDHSTEPYLPLVVPHGDLRQLRADVTGWPKLGCETFLRDYHPGKVRIEPLTHFPILRDLAIDQTDFLKKLESVKPYLVPRKRNRGTENLPSNPRQMDEYYRTRSALTACFATRPARSMASTRLRPAALALLHRYNADSRDAGKRERMEVVNAEDGVWGCTLVGYCSEVCPKGVDPARAINQNKIESTKDYFLRFLKK